MPGPRIEMNTNLQTSDWKKLQGGDDVRDFLVPLFLQIDISQLRRVSYSSDPIPTMKPEGKDFATALAYLKLNRTEDFSQIENILRELVPSFQRIRFVREEFTKKQYRPGSKKDGYYYAVRRSYIGDRLILDFTSGQNITPEGISEGTLMILGILTGVFSNSAKLILIDDIDRGLHPKAQRGFISYIRKLLETDADLQIIATTHSPYFLDELDAKEVRVTSLREDGSAACARLDQHPKFERMSQAMFPGEFWGHVGEKWVTELPTNGTHQTSEPLEAIKT
jgi:predicted ATPase